MENVEYLGFLIEIVLSEEGTYEYSLFDMTGKDKPEFPLFETDDVGFVSYEAAVDDAKSWIRDFAIHDDDRVEEHIEKLYATKKALVSSLSVATAGGVFQKLTVDVFNRSDCPKWAKYAAMAPDGVIAYYRDYPLSEALPAFNYSIIKDSLVERPTKLPDWCKVGEWCYCKDDDGNDKYFKIVRVDRDFIYGDYGWDIAIPFAKPARLRPYNDDELRGLVGKIISNSSCDLLVIAYSSHKHAIKINEIWRTAYQLFSGEGTVSGYTIDGKQCGIFEHLNDAGEWVE